MMVWDDQEWDLNSTCFFFFGGEGDLFCHCSPFVEDMACVSFCYS